MDKDQNKNCEENGYAYPESPGYVDKRTPEQKEKDKEEWKRFLKFERDNGID